MYMKNVISVTMATCSMCTCTFISTLVISLMQVSMEDSSRNGQSQVFQFSETQSHSQTLNQDPDVINDSVILPNPSPRKGVCGSFLNRPPPAGSPHKPQPGPPSPHAKQLEDILARSTSSAEKVQSSPLRAVGAVGGKRAGSPLASARRRLDLGGDKEVCTYTMTCSSDVIGPITMTSLSWCQLIAT